jgi:hypothetical protein
MSSSRESSVMPIVSFEETRISDLSNKKKRKGRGESLKSGKKRKLKLKQKDELSMMKRIKK